MGLWELLLLVAWLLPGLIAAQIAQNKGRSGVLWLFLGFLLGPIALFGVALLSPTPEGALHSGASQKCPYCAEIIKAEAVKCRYCGADLATQNSTP